jgi:hypothetical protein
VQPAGDFYPPDSETIEPDSDDPRATFQCSLDGAPFGLCPADGVYESLTVGPHRLLVRALDAAGNVDRTPAEADWTVAATVVQSPFAPPGELVAGESSNLTTLLGDILVFLQGKGFLPLAQAASIPIGTPIDARKGTLRVDTAASFTKPGAAQSAQVSAGIFVIRQQRAGRGAAHTDLALQTPAGHSRACAARTKPPKGVVRALTVNVTKGVYRTLAAVARVTTGRAKVTVQDTCEGTRIHVTRGHASVYDTRTKRTRTVRAGRSLLIRARLFAARMHRA